MQPLPQPASTMHPSDQRYQVDESTLAGRADRSDTNIWSGRKLDRPMGPDGRPDFSRGPKEKSKYRCRPELDVGRTRGSDAKQMQFCLYFSK